MLEELQWDSLETRRQAASLVLMFKIQSGTVAINPAHYLTPRTPSITRSYHPNQFQTIPARIQMFQNSFFPRTINWWNALPGDVVASASIEAFKGGIAAST